MSLDEAFRIALRLEAWQKSIQMPKNDEDRIERPRQKIRTTGKQPKPKAPEFVGHSDQIKQLKTDMSKMSADVNRQYEELKKLIVWKHTAASGAGKSSSVVFCFSWSVGCSAVSKFGQSEIRFGRGKCDDARRPS